MEAGRRRLPRRSQPGIKYHWDTGQRPLAGQEADSLSTLARHARIHLHAVENSCLLPFLTMLVLAVLAEFLASCCRNPFPGFRLFPLILSAVLQQCARSVAVRCITRFIAQHYKSMKLHNSIDTHCCKMTAVAGLSGSCTHLAADQTVCSIHCNYIPAYTVWEVVRSNHAALARPCRGALSRFQVGAFPG